MTVSHVAWVRARAGRSDEVGRLLLQLVAPVRSMQGCLDFAVELSAEELWRIEGRWAGQRHYQAFSTAALVTGLFTLLLNSGALFSIECRSESAGVHEETPARSVRSLSAQPRHWWLAAAASQC